MCFRMFIVFSHVAEDYRCLIDFNFLSVDDHPCFHGFSQMHELKKKQGQWTVQTCFVLTIPALWIQHVGCFAQERLVSGMLLIQLPWHTLATLKLHISSLKNNVCYSIDMELWIVVSRNSFKGALMGSIRATHQFFMDPLA